MSSDPSTFSSLPDQPTASESEAPTPPARDDSPSVVSRKPSNVTLKDMGKVDDKDKTDSDDPTAKVRVVIKESPQKTRKRRNTFIFLLGSLFGIVAAGFFAKNTDLIDFPGIGELSMANLLDVLPAGLVTDMRDLIQGEREYLDSYDAFSVGLKAREEGLEVHHPMILIPGVISTGLESWGTSNISRPYFRKRLWGSWSMMRALVLDKENWKRHIILDKVTGLDPPNVKLRAAQGFDATDFFITGYWIWNKILENLASMGYDPTNSQTAAYDWRLSFPNLEVRDQYFTRLKGYIEMAHLLQGKKVVLTSHSMGSQVLFYFFHWVASPLGGDGGDDWVERHVDSWINISGCMLGAVKDVTAILSGEMRDTAQLNSFAVYGLEKFLSKEERAEMFRSMPGMSSMLPIGGEAVWGNLTWAPDDVPGQNLTFGSFLNFRPQPAPPGSTSETEGTTTSIIAEPETRDPNKAPGPLPPPRRQNMTIQQSMEFLLASTEGWYGDMVQRTYSQGVAHTREEVEANELDPRKWVNPLETRLPLAPSLKIYCFYGVGKPTERAYYYRDLAPVGPQQQQQQQQAQPRQEGGEGEDGGGSGGAAGGGGPNLNVTIDTSYTTETMEVDHGVVMGEGDGTVNLLSTGYMCNKGWKDIKRYNPAGVEVKVFEMPHQPEKYNMRGGPKTADHVDILGRGNLNELILKVAGGRGGEIEEFVVSRIGEYAERVRIWDEE